MSDGRILPPWVPAQASNPPDVLEVMKANIDSIDRFTDRIIALTRSGRIEDAAVKAWESAEDMYHMAVQEIGRLREEATSDD